MGVIMPTSPSPSISDNPVGVPLIGYNNIITSGSRVSALSPAVDGFPISNVANPATHLIWQGGVLTSGIDEVYLNVSGSPVPIDYIGIAGHNFGSGAIGLDVTAGGSPDVSLIGGFTLPTDDTPIIIRFAAAAYSQLTLRLDFDTVAPEIAVIYAGQVTPLERGIRVDVTHIPLPFGRVTRIVNGMSEAGNFLGRLVLSESRASKAEFFAFTPTFYRSTMDAFLIAAQESPFFWAWAPSDYPLETGYSWLTADAQPEVSPDHRRIALTLEMAGIA
jgi:hypothetical protein